MCGENKATDAEDVVPDFSVVGFDQATKSLVKAPPTLPNVKALRLEVCVGASYDPGTNKICFNVPVYGDLCVTSPITIPVGGELKACAKTCGPFIPTGLKVTIYLNGNPIYSGTVVGSC